MCYFISLIKLGVEIWRYNIVSFFKVFLKNAVFFNSCSLNCHNEINWTIIIYIIFYSSSGQNNGKKSTTLLLTEDYVSIRTPDAIFSNNGTQFVSIMVTGFFKEFGMQIKFVSAVHPQANIQVESTNKVILKGL